MSAVAQGKQKATDKVEVEAGATRTIRGNVHIHSPSYNTYEVNVDMPDVPPEATVVATFTGSNGRQLNRQSFHGYKCRPNDGFFTFTTPAPKSDTCVISSDDTSSGSRTPLVAPVAQMRPPPENKPTTGPSGSGSSSAGSKPSRVAPVVNMRPPPVQQPGTNWPQMYDPQAPHSVQYPGIAGPSQRRPPYYGPLYPLPPSGLYGHQLWCPPSGPAAFGQYPYPAQGPGTWMPQPRFVGQQQPPPSASTQQQVNWVPQPASARPQVHWVPRPTLTGEEMDRVPDLSLSPLLDGLRGAAPGSENTTPPAASTHPSEDWNSTHPLLAPLHGTREVNPGNETWSRSWSLTVLRLNLVRSPVKAGD